MAASAVCMMVSGDCPNSAIYARAECAGLGCGQCGTGILHDMLLSSAAAACDAQDCAHPNSISAHPDVRCIGQHWDHLEVALHQGLVANRTLRDVAAVFAQWDGGFRARRACSGESGGAVSAAPREPFTTQRPFTFDSQNRCPQLVDTARAAPPGSNAWQHLLQ